MMSLRCALLLMLALQCTAGRLVAQQEGQQPSRGSTFAPEGSDSIEYRVRQGQQRLELAVNGSKILTLPGRNIPRVLVNNPNLDPRLKPGGKGQQLNLNAQEINAVIAFLKTLSGSEVYTHKKWSNPFP